MPGDIEGVQRKIERANKHIADLARERTAFLNTNPYRTVAKFNPKIGQTEWALIDSKPVPKPIPEIAGDAIHNLRSAWDHLSYQLAVANGITDPKALSRICFPIAESRGEYKKIFGRKVEPFLGKEAKEAIELLQPYKGANDEFWGLHELDIRDKHRVLILTFRPVPKLGIAIDSDVLRELVPDVAIDPFPPEVVWFNEMGTLGTNNGDIVCRLFGDYESNKNVELGFDIALGEPEIFKGRSIAKHLRALSDYFSSLIARTFEPLLR